MLNNNAKIELKMNMGERSYQFLCDNNSPIGELYDALSAMRHYVSEKIQEIESKEKQEEING